MELKSGFWKLEVIFRKISDVLYEINIIIDTKQEL